MNAETKENEIRELKKELEGTNDATEKIEKELDGRLEFLCLMTVPAYFCAIYGYAGKEDLSKG